MPIPSESPLVEARGLTKRFGDHLALDSLDLSIHAGDVYCLLGANGAGKSTTINCFLDFVKPDAGVAIIAGTVVARDPIGTKRRLAYIPETVMLYGNLSALENLEYFAMLATGRRPIRVELAAHLRTAGLSEAQLDQRVGGFSKGMRQKVGIAIALAKGADVLLLDEPTSGLDPLASNEFHRLLGLMRERGAAVLMATHDLFRAKESGTRIGIMKAGRKVAELRADEIGHADLEQLYLTHMHD
jgi:ABC-2 type transport system ATP-binding protein